MIKHLILIICIIILGRLLTLLGILDIPKHAILIVGIVMGYVGGTQSQTFVFKTKAK